VTDLLAQQRIVESIVESDAASGFDCENEELNGFFARHAFPNDRRGIGRTFVLRRWRDEDELPEVIGFYTLSMASLERDTLPRKLRGNLPGYPLPVALVGRLAVDKRAKKRGFGELLLGDAFDRILAAAESVGCFGVVVDAKSASAATYYERFDFVALDPSEVYPRRMFLPMKTLFAARSR
jgi:predicted N-acetyltransferase YhbS